MVVAVIVVVVVVVLVVCVLGTECKMLCKKPYMIGVLPFGCGQCMPCRINRRRLWTHRLMLESIKHPGCCFVTLTYNEENIPPYNSLDPAHPRDWLKRLRARISPLKIRYYLVGEYGDQTQRPHYHLALFGLDQSHVPLIEETWRKGHVYVGDLTADSASYIAGYVTKKMTSWEDPRLEGRHPEFARMSLRPGIGADAMDDVAVSLDGEWGSVQISETGDVPTALQHGRKKLPLGRYLRRKLREKVGFVSSETPTRSMEIFAQKMRELHTKNGAFTPGSNESLGKNLVRSNRQKVLNLESKSKLMGAKKTL